MNTLSRVECDPEDDPMDISTPTKVIQKRALAEIFSIRLIGQEQNLEFHGVILIKGSERKRVIFEDRGDGKPSRINSEGYFTLMDSECIEVDDRLVIYPWLFHSLYECDDNQGVTLWRWSLSQVGTDRFIRRGFETAHGAMRVNFVVYSDGVEAKFEIDLCSLNISKLLERDESVKIYGTVKVSNNVVTHSEAKTVLFDHIANQECVTLGLGLLDNAKILPLTKSTMVVPRKSILCVDISLFVHCVTEDVCIINGSAVFETRPGCSTTLDVSGDHGTIKIKATWSN